MQNSECRLIEQNMNDFLENRLVGEDLQSFLEHVNECPVCYEELETRYLLAKALTRVENGETINLRKEIKQRLSKAEDMLRLHKTFAATARTVEVVALVIIAFTIIELIEQYI